MNAMLLKLAPRIPELIARALAGDVTAAAALSASEEVMRQNRRPAFLEAGNGLQKTPGTLF